ncbi:RHS repeat domain-containing protein [Candidatus Colwellia aromaticivorans]|uniref:RHS repeat domain-containing protein n=1 Tax=Candidatus Colwellia aromaticivorans TaxID=2267621 RepID=UPI000DF13082|nr:RHS repeat-associated core domain-containing protein [Candidatus Colwellia aromaticivorans]
MIFKITDAQDNITNLTNDLIGRVTQKEAVLTNDDNQLIDFTYDGNSNITGMVLPTGNEHLFEFNAVDKETAYVPPNIALPDHKTERFYDLDKRLTRITYPSGDDVTFNYHVTKGQLTSINTPQGDIAMSYQPTTGLLAQIEAANGQQLIYQYDGDLVLSESWANGTVGNVNRQYNNHFLVNSISVNGDAVAYGYDKDNLVVQAGDLTLERDAQNGTLTSTTIASINTNQTVNGFSELTDYQASYDNSTLFHTDYTRDGLGRITSLSETVNGQTTTFNYSYDQLGQLVEVKQDGTIIQSYQFDANGNRTLHNGIVATFDAQDRLLTRGTAVYLYDANGALTTITDNGETKQFSYDLAGNLLNATVNGKTIDYIIDGKNRRVGKKVNGILQQGFLYQDQLNPIAELDKDNNVVSRFIYGDKINVPSVMEKDGKTYRIISDHLGSVRLVVDISDGAVVQQLSYDTNGVVLEDTNPSFQPFGFAGGIYDTDTGLVRFGARDYDSVTARWTTKDPIRFDGGVNLYGYVKNDPVNFVDPTGEVAANFISAGIGAFLGGFKAYSSGGSFADVAKAALIGGASNFLTGKALFDAVNGFVSNLAGQTLDPCFSGLNFKQAAVAALLGGTGFGGDLAKKVLPKNSGYVAEKASGQSINNTILDLF